MSNADDKARQIIEYVRCAQINMDNVFEMYPTVVRLCPHLKIVKHQIDCAVAHIEGKPEPEII